MDDVIAQVLREWGAYGAILAIVLWGLRNRSLKVDELQNTRVEESRVAIEALIASTEALGKIADNQKTAARAIDALADEIRRKNQ